MLATGCKVQWWGWGVVKTGSGSHNYKLPKRGGLFAKFCVETGLLLLK